MRSKEKLCPYCGLLESEDHHWEFDSHGIILIRCCKCGGQHPAYVPCSPNSRSKMFEEPEKTKCLGLFYRGRINSYANARGDYVYKESMTLLKRKSCPGCNNCYFLHDNLREIASEEYRPIIRNIEDGALYSLQAVNPSRDWETGIIDDWDLEFVKMEEANV